MDEVEQALYLGWVKVGSEMPQLRAVKAFGILAIRCILHLLGKETLNYNIDLRGTWDFFFIWSLVFN